MMNERIHRALAVLGAKAVPDDHPVFNGIPQGECVLRDGVFIVRESEWFELLRLTTIAKYGEERGNEIMKEVMDKIKREAH